MDSTSVNPLIFSLKEHGKVLANSLRDAKKQNRPNNIIIHNVTNAINNITQKLNNPQLPSSCPETVISKVLEKIQDTLEKLKKFDLNNAPKYEVLANKVKEHQQKNQSFPIKSTLSPTTPQDPYTTEETQVRDFSTLSDEEKKCLVSFCLFSPGKEVKKREPINIWISLDLIDDSIKGSEMLAKLVSEGFVDRTIGNKKLCNRYKINESVRSKLTKDMCSSIFIDEKESLSILTFQPTLQEQPELPSNSPGAPTLNQTQQPNQLLRRLSKLKSKNDRILSLVLNRSEHTIGVSTLNQLSKKSEVKVLHLGCWDHDHKRYIMVQDIDTFKTIIKSMSQVTFLSLQGISGIVELPDSVYKLEYLKVLDLRGCPNMESLPEGIDSLKKLTHLDLSECYLLGHIPSKITSLTSLRVLKGFVINPQDQGNEIGKGKSSAPESASFSELFHLKELIKLTIRTRRLNFPNIEDFDSLWKMDKLVNLRIAWVSSSIEDQNEGAFGKFPASLKKLELQAAPNNTMLRLIRVLSEDSENTLEKLYIRGGRIRDLNLEMHCPLHVHTVSLRYLKELQIEWDKFNKIFPKLTRFEVTECPNIVFFPCNENSVWEETYIGYSP